MQFPEFTVELGCWWYFPLEYLPVLWMPASREEASWSVPICSPHILYPRGRCGVFSNMVLPSNSCKKLRAMKIRWAAFGVPRTSLTNTPRGIGRLWEETLFWGNSNKTLTYMAVYKVVSFSMAFQIPLMLDTSPSPSCAPPSHPSPHLNLQLFPLYPWNHLCSTVTLPLSLFFPLPTNAPFLVSWNLQVLQHRHLKL